MLITPDWPAPRHIRAISTLRDGGVSEPPYDSFNLGAHVGDNPESVRLNRERLRKLAKVPQEPFWLNQVHSTSAIEIGKNFNSNLSEPPTADGCYTRDEEYVCTVLTADCLPVLLTNQQGTKVAAVHAGWRGLAHGIIENVLKQWFHNDKVLAWLGPAISQQNFEVGPEVKDIFLRETPSLGKHFEAFHQKYKANLYGIARTKLEKFKVDVYGGGFCTYAEEERYFSYRRTATTGRMASLIWIEAS